MEKKVKEIITNEVSEKNWLDFKVVEYDSTSRSKNKLLKEVIGMLNSEESYKKDKFIIMGIADNGYVKGIKKLRDDNEYQNEFNNIQPRPTIEKSHCKIDGKIVSYLYISKGNTERPYAVKRELNLGKYSLSQGASFIRRGTKNYPLEESERRQLIFKTMAYNPGKTKLLQQINASIKLKKEEFEDQRLSGSREINPSQNNGIFTFGYNKYKFKICFQAASNDVGRIYSDYDDIRVGKITNRNSLIETYNQAVDKIDFSSRVVDLYFNETGVVINQYDSLIFLEILDVQSQSHGKPEDKISFKWQIVGYNNE